jgi:hypothetical protein
MVVVAIWAWVAACSDAPGEITPPVPAPTNPTTPNTPVPGPAARMVVTTAPSGVTIWPVEAGSLQFQVAVFDAATRPTTANVYVEATPSVPLTFSQQSPGTTGFWWLRHGANALNVQINDALDTTLVVEGVSAGVPPTDVTQFVLDSIDGKPLPFDWPAASERTTLRSAEVTLRGTSWVLTYGIESSSASGTQRRSVTGTTVWRDGVSSLRTDLLASATAVLERGGRLQMLAPDVPFAETSWPLPGRRSDYHRVP